MTSRTEQTVVIKRDITFAHAACGDVMRPLQMDMYRPAGREYDRLPAVVLAFGGAFHRGSRQDDTVTEDGKSNTPIAEYCRMLATHGFAAFSVDYRLAQEEPRPGQTPVLADMDVPLERIRVVRDILGLDPITPERMRDVQEAAIDDMASAFRYVCGASRRLGIDPRKVVVGGFSAGGRNAITAAFGEAIDPAGVISLSSYVPDFVVERRLLEGNALLPVLAISAENDLGYIRKALPKQHETLRRGGGQTIWRVVPDYGHFYPADAATLDGLTKAPACTVFGEILQFLDGLYAEDDWQGQDRDDLSGLSNGNSNPNNSKATIKC
ncbi:alpha/beta hydrolase [Neptunicoccus cionae]|uniref:alpha/beta hydrolase n=1 Tax=Neptunicoccus cionae TaxID=2035344 RepID=UPI000C76DDDF|nr:alpha/beta hydrolase [Amylibacter cionae]PLS23622.1 hypothetical protein C0U40_05835 [Amylibacter cionae]